MTKAIVLPTSASPVLIKYLVYQFNRWEKYFDKMHVVINYFVEPDQKDYILKLLKHPKIKVYIYSDIDFKTPSLFYQKIIKELKEEIIFFIHDDVIIYDNKVFEKYLPLVEKGFIVAPAHLTYSGKEIEKVNSYFKDIFFKNVIDTTESFNCFSFLTSFLFVKRKDILKTNLNFGGVTYKKGIYNKLLGFVPTEDINCDMCDISFGLLNNGVKWIIIPNRLMQGYVHSGDTVRALESDKKNNQGVFFSGWLHITGMGHGLTELLAEDEEIIKEIINQPPYLTDTIVRNSMALRLAFVKGFLLLMKDNKVYQKEMEKKIKFIVSVLNLKEMNRCYPLIKDFI